MSFLDDFKKFAFRGNVVDLAVGVVIGGAFGKIVSAMVDDVVMPMVSLFMPSGNWRAAGIVIRHGTDSKDDVVLHYGNMLGAVLDFFIVALVLFVLVKQIMQAAERTLHLSNPAPKMKQCTECLSDVPAGSRRCKFCTSQLAA